MVKENVIPIPKTQKSMLTLLLMILYLKQLYNGDSITITGCSPENVDSKNKTVALSRKQATKSDRKSLQPLETMSSVDRCFKSKSTKPTKPTNMKLLTNQASARKQNRKCHQNVAEFGVGCPVNAKPVDSTRPHTCPINQNSFRIRRGGKPPSYQTAHRHYSLEWLIHLDTVSRMTRQRMSIYTLIFARSP